MRFSAGRVTLLNKFKWWNMKHALNFIHITWKCECISWNLFFICMLNVHRYSQKEYFQFTVIFIKSKTLWCFFKSVVDKYSVIVCRYNCINIYTSGLKYGYGAVYWSLCVYVHTEILPTSELLLYTRRLT